MLSEKSQQIVLERDRGQTTVQLAAAHGISSQRVSAIMRDATRFVNEVELDLMVARNTGEQCAYLLPFQPG